MKVRFILIFFGMFLSGVLISQDYSDADRLSQLSYMELSDRIDCDSTEGTNLEHRICLNLEFQQLDSLMNLRYVTLLDNIEDDSIKNSIVRFHGMWIQNRRIQSNLLSKGYRGHMVGIYYLSGMVNSTRKRLEELEYLLRMLMIND